MASKKKPPMMASEIAVAPIPTTTKSLTDDGEMKDTPANRALAT
jgi:hypothetical protein